MLHIALLAGLLFSGAAPQSEDGFTPLFDGKDLSQWVIPEGDNGHWKVVDGAIDYDARSEAPGAKDLVSKQAYGDYVLKLDWRIKETPFINPNIPYVLPDGTHAKGVDGKELKLALPDCDSGVFIKYPNSKAQVNIWCWPIGSGEVYGYRMDKAQPPAVRAGVTPKHQADKPAGEWNTFEITVKGEHLSVVLNGVKVLENAHLPGLPARGPIALQHHGGFRNGKYTGPPSLVQYRNIRIKPLDNKAAARTGDPARPAPTVGR